MSEVKIFRDEQEVQYATGKSAYIEGKRLQPGQVVKLTHLAAKFQNIAVSEYIELGYWNGHSYVELKKAVPTAIGYFVHWDGEIYLREEQWIYAYLVDVANGELMTLRGLGVWV